MKHKLDNDKYDVSIIKINVYIGMILPNKLTHIKNQCKTTRQSIWTSVCFNLHNNTNMCNLYVNNTICGASIANAYVNMYLKQTLNKTFTYEKIMYTSRILMQMSKHNMFASLERNPLSNPNMLNLNVSIVDCTPHTAKPYVKMYPQTHKKHLHAKRQC